MTDIQTSIIPGVKDNPSDVGVVRQTAPAAPPTQAELKEQRTDEMQAARAAALAEHGAKSPAAAAHDAAVNAADLAAANRLGAEIAANARAANARNATANAAAAQAAQNNADLAQGVNASRTIAADLANLGLGAMSDWATRLAYSLTGTGVSAGDAVNTVISQLNAPTENGVVGGPIDQTALAAFNAALPGFNQRIIDMGNNGSPGATDPGAAIGAYLLFKSQVLQFANTAQLLPGTITDDQIGELWAHADTSSDEVSARITGAVTNANLAMANPAIAQYLQMNGLNANALTSYYINPENTMAQLNNLNVGIGGAAAGMGDLSSAQSKTLAAFLQTPSGTTGISNVTAQQAVGALTQNLGLGLTGAAQMANAGFTQAAYGQQANSPGVVTQDQLLNAVEGNAGALADVRRATETRTAGAAGGGGFAAGQTGVSGAGYGNQE